ncbi:hypothetical protein CHT76_08740 [Listeria monocytogenes]|nr:hypothetical protein [Listeria monocytogenes]EAG8712025.1 hypothetical protein [Listeria monocytogenes]EAG8730871.1 hypothetical protein [Listeria monocytogenes]
MALDKLELDNNLLFEMAKQELAETDFNNIKQIEISVTPNDFEKNSLISINITRNWGRHVDKNVTLKTGDTVDINLDSSGGTGESGV